MAFTFTLAHTHPYHFCMTLQFSCRGMAKKKLRGAAAAATVRGVRQRAAEGQSSQASSPARAVASSPAHRHASSPNGHLVGFIANTACTHAQVQPHKWMDLRTLTHLLISFVMHPVPPDAHLPYSFFA